MTKKNEANICSFKWKWWLRCVYSCFLSGTTAIARAHTHRIIRKRSRHSIMSTGYCCWAHIYLFKIIELNLLSVLCCDDKRRTYILFIDYLRWTVWVRVLLRESVCGNYQSVSYRFVSKQFRWMHYLYQRSYWLRMLAVWNYSRFH